jgi:3-dehydroquinate dehydratase type I
METKDEDLIRIVGFAINKEVNLIFSHHNLKKTPSFNKVQNNIKQFINKLEDKFNLNLDSLENYVFKMIFTAEKLTDNLIPLKLCSELNNDYNIVSFCMGKEGKFSRVFCTHFGSFFTYGSLEKKTASGQIKIEKIRKFHQFMLDL